MKRLLLSVFMMSFCLISFSQVSYGVRAGLNAGGEQATASNFKGIKIGYHVGLQTKVNLGGFYIMPELVYTKLGGEYEDETISDLNLDIQKIDLPVSFGIKFLEVISVFAGPGLQYIIDVNSDNHIEDIKNKVSLFYNVGVGVSLSKFGVNLRYESGFSKEDLELSDKLTGLTLPKNISTAPNQLILAVTFSFL